MLKLISSIIHALCHLPFAFSLKLYLKRLVRQNARTLRRLLPMRKTKRIISPSRDIYRRFFGLNRNVKQIDIAQLKYLNRKLRAIEPDERAHELTYAGAINVEAQIIRRVFRWALGLELSSAEVTELKYWDSPIRVLKAFVMYCLQYESAIVEYSLGGEHILGLFILTSQEHIREGRVERPAGLSQQVSQSRSRTREAWKKRLILLANLSAIEIHNRSAAIAAQTCKEDRRFESIRQELKDNYRLCHRKLEDKLWRRAS